MKKNCQVWKRERNKENHKMKRTRTPLPPSQEVMKMLQFSLMKAYILVIKWLSGWLILLYHIMLCQTENCSPHTKHEILGV